MVTLKNVGKRMLSMELEKCDGAAVVLNVTTHDKKTGKIGRRRLPRTVYPTLSLTPGESKENLPDAVMECASVKRFIRCGWLTAKQS